ncbi:MAG: HD domain-containing protein [Clostridia bacterium]|nr:HD domain-containing protein [Clostridia bacterium]
MKKPLTTLHDLVRALPPVMNIISHDVQDHHQKVAYLSCVIAEEMGLSEQERLLTLGGAMLHDVGGILREGAITLEDIEQDAAALAQAGAALLGGHPVTRFFADVVRHSQTPWRSAAPSLRTLLRARPVLIGQIVHLADTVALLLEPDKPVLNQVDHIRQCVEGAGDREYHPDVRKAFDAVSRREGVWLDMLYRPERFLDFLPDDRWVTLEEALQYTDIISRLIDFRSPFTAMHSAGVAATAEALARLAGMCAEECLMMRMAGNLHDIGKLKIPREILEKPGKLTDEEFNVMKEHAYFSYVILREIRGFDQIAVWAAFHHEKLNGAGYPFHLKADEIPLGARIMAVADVFSAITEDRPYRKGMDPDKARAVLRGDAAKGALSGELVELLIANFDAINAARDEAAHAAGQRYYAAMEKEDAQAK